MDAWDELEAMAQAAMDQPEPESNIDCDTVKRWQALFGYTHAEAAQQIQEQRADLGRLRLSDQAWNMVADKKQQGYDKEAYEHACWLARSRQPSRGHQPPSKRARSQIYLLKLEGPLADAEFLKAATGLENTPPRHHATDDAGQPTAFCKVGAVEKERILLFLSTAGSAFQPTFIRYSKAEKALSGDSLYPTLGLDATLPQHRPQSSEDPALLPAQHQYPVWYFFYGTLADPTVLGRLLDMDDEPVYQPARIIRGGVLTTWGGKYKALVDDAVAMAGKRDVPVHGSAFLVQNEDQEEALCRYETDRYEVVRCEIDMGTGKEAVRGLAFRFIRD